MPWGMTGHVLYRAIDPSRPGTLSPIVIGDIIRGEIGFDGVLVSDDLSMGALEGGLGDRAARALAAGCDIALHCNGRMDEMEAVVLSCGALTDAAVDHIARAAAMRRADPDPVDAAALRSAVSDALARLEAA
jgi:beta-N-acetylhexosaminidase